MTNQTEISVPPTTPSVSIVTVYYNRADHVADSIQSLLNQTLDDIEIIAVDDGSTDGTVAALQRFDDPRLRIIEQKNSGFVVGINRAIRASRGRYVAIHGSGDISFPDRVAAQAAVLDTRPEVGVVGCYVQNQDPLDPSKFHYFKSPNGVNFQQAMLNETLFTHGEVMFRRELFDRVGGYREFFRFAQDRDLWLRMSRHCGYYIVERLLYQRFKLEDGVGTSVDKLILQGLLSDFAVQCARSCAKDGRDLLERYGAAAPLLRSRSLALAQRYYGFGRLMLIGGRLPEAQRMFEASHAEVPSIKAQIFLTVLGIQRKSPVAWITLVRPMLLAAIRARTAARSG
jgi:glycosyltransferase involved in cell wall biosynthesis